MNLMDYVTMVFMRYFGYPRERATQLMIQVHNRGRATVAEGNKDRDGGSRACDARLRFAGLGRKGRPRMRIEGTRNRWIWYLEHVEITGIETALGHYVEALSRLRADPAHSTTEGDPFAFWESQFSGLQEDDEVRRLILPSAYRDDDSADAQFHVDHDAEDVAARWEDAQSLSADVETLHRTGCISMNPVMTQRWLRTVNALRGMMAARLGIIDQVTADEVARAAREELDAEEECVYEWLGLVVEVLVEVELSE